MSFDKIFDLTAGMYFNFQNNTSKYTAWDILLDFFQNIYTTTTVVVPAKITIVSSVSHETVNRQSYTTAPYFVQQYEHLQSTYINTPTCNAKSSIPSINNLDRIPTAVTVPYAQYFHPYKLRFNISNVLLEYQTVSGF